MSAAIAPPMFEQFMDPNNSGSPLVGGQLFIYTAGTSTKATTWTDSTQGTPNANPLVLDGNGIGNVWLDPTKLYKFVLAPKNDSDPPASAYRTVDNISGSITLSTLTLALLGPILYPQTTSEFVASVTPVNFQYPEGCLDRYLTNTTPGTTDMTAAFTAAMAVMNAKGGGYIYALPYTTYKVTSAINFPVACQRITLRGFNSTIKCAHAGDGIVNVSTNENFGAHIIEGWFITGPDALANNAARTSTGAGIQMSRNATTNAVAAYNSVIRDCVIGGFSKGISMQAVIGLNVFGSQCWFNDYGVWMDGGQTNANHFFGTHIRYNKKAGVYSTGRTGGSLTSATQNVFHACLIESNIPDVTASGGSPPTDSTAIYLNNSYDFSFVDCYSENHAASIYLTGGSKSNHFIRHRCAPGTGRIDQIILDGSGIYSNEFDLKCLSASLTEVSVVSNNSDQLYNKFTGEGINFVSGSISGVLNYEEVAPSLVFANTKGYGLIRMPAQGYTANAASGTGPGQINGIGTGTAALNATGFGEIVLGSNITGNTTITTLSGVAPNSFLMIRCAQASFSVTLSGATFGTWGAKDVVMNNGGQQILFWTSGDLGTREVTRNFTTSGAYTVTNGSADRALNVTADTLAQGLAVVGTLISDLQQRGVIP